MSPCYCSLLRTATRRVGSLYDAALAPSGINIAQYSLLRTVERLQPVSLTELAASTELDRSTIGRNIRVLERLSLVKIGRGEEDQREAVVGLTGRGEALLGEAGPIWEACQQEIENRLGPVKVTALREILRAM